MIPIREGWYAHMTTQMHAPRMRSWMLRDRPASPVCDPCVKTTLELRSVTHGMIMKWNRSRCRLDPNRAGEVGRMILVVLLEATIPVQDAANENVNFLRT